MAEEDGWRTLRVTADEAKFLIGLSDRLRTQDGMGNEKGPSHMTGNPVYQVMGTTRVYGVALFEKMVSRREARIHASPEATGRAVEEYLTHGEGYSTADMGRAVVALESGAPDRMVAILGAAVKAAARVAAAADDDEQGRKMHAFFANRVEESENG